MQASKQANKTLELEVKKKKKRKGKEKKLGKSIGILYSTEQDIEPANHLQSGKRLVRYILLKQVVSLDAPFSNEKWETDIQKKSKGQTRNP